jgi:hypothetical protein
MLVVVERGGQEVAEALGDAALEVLQIRVGIGRVLERMAVLVQDHHGIGGVRHAALPERDALAGGLGTVRAALALRVHRDGVIAHAGDPEVGLDVLLEAVDVMVGRHVEELPALLAENEGGFLLPGLGVGGLGDCLHPHPDAVEVIGALHPGVQALQRHRDALGIELAGR